MEAAMPAVECPGCHRSFPIPDEFMGRWIACPHCNMGFAAMPDEPEESAVSGYDPFPGYGPSRSPGTTAVVATLGVIGSAALVALMVAVANSSWDEERPAAGKPSGEVAKAAPTPIKPARRAQPVGLDPEDPVPENIRGAAARKPEPKPGAAYQTVQDPVPPSLTADQVAHDPPGIRALLNHPWWRGRVDRKHLDKILTLMTSHGGGVVFFDWDGKSLWTVGVNSSSRHDFPDWANLLMYHIEATRAFRELASMSAHRKLVPITVGAGKRLSQENAIALLQDYLNFPDKDELGTKGNRFSRGIIDDFLNQRGVEDWKKPRPLAPADGRMNIPAVKGVQGPGR
jgi:hypothetical protein